MTFSNVTVYYTDERGVKHDLYFIKDNSPTHSIHPNINYIDAICRAPVAPHASVRIDVIFLGSLHEL